MSTDQKIYAYKKPMFILMFIIFLFHVFNLFYFRPLSIPTKIYTCVIQYNNYVFTRVAKHSFTTFTII